MKSRRYWIELASASPAESNGELQAALTDARSRGDLSEEVVVCQALGIAARGRMRLTESVAHLERAIEVAGSIDDHAAGMQCRITLAGTLAYSGMFEDAVTMIEDVVSRTDEGLQLQAMVQRIPILGLAGFNRQALAASEELLLLGGAFADDETVVWRARIHQSRSMIFLYLGEPDAGIHEAETAIAIYERLGNEAGIARTRHNLASLRGLRGDHVGSLEEFATVEQELRRLDIPLAICADGRIAGLLTAGLCEDAATEAAAAMQDLERRGASGLFVEAAIWHAFTQCHLGRWENVSASAQAAGRALASQGRPAWEALANALDVEGRAGGLAGALGMSLALDRLAPEAQKRVDSIAADAERAAADMDLHGWAQSTRAAVIAALLGVAAGRPDASARLELLGALTKSDLLERRLLGHLVTGVVAFRAFASQPDQVDLAVSAWRLGIDEFDGLNDAASTVDGELLLHSVRRTLASTGAHLLLLAGRSAEALLWIERERAAATTKNAMPERDGELDAVFADLRAIRLQAAAPAADAATAELAGRQATAERRLQAWSVRSSVGRRSQRLAPAAGVSLIVDGDDLHALVCDGGTTRHHRLGPTAAVLATSRRLRSAFERLALGAAQLTRVEHTIGVLLDELSAALVDPWIDGVSGEAPLALSTPRELDVPWCALTTLQLRPIVLSRSLTEPPTAIDESAKSRAPAGVIAIAGPGLPYAAAEAEGVVAVAGGSVIEGGAATRRAVIDALSTGSTVHLACHGSFRIDQPMFSTLELADGPMFIHELQPSRVSAGLVVVSACNAGRRSDRTGGAGLAQALRSLGAAQVIAPYAPVNDELSAHAMRALHVALVAGMPPAAALASMRADPDLVSAVRLSALLFGLYGPSSPAAP